MPPRPSRRQVRGSFGLVIARPNASTSARKPWRRREDAMLGMMQDQPLLVSRLLSHAANYHGDTEIVSRTRRRADPPLYLRRGRARRQAARPGADASSASSRATGSARSPGTPIAISSCITASPASARSATRSIRACSTSSSSTSSTTRSDRHPLRRGKLPAAGRAAAAATPRELSPGHADRDSARQPAADRSPPMTS